MTIIKRTNSGDNDFQLLIRELDIDLKIRDGKEHSFFAALNKTDTIRHTVVVYENDKAIGCGAIREYAPGTMEIKRIFVSPEKRGQGIASAILTELEKWSKELNYTQCILETSERQPEAIRLYEKNNYNRIPNYGAYKEVKSSVCFEKKF